MKRTSVAIAIALFGLFAIAGGWRRLASASSPVGAEQVIHMTAKRFEYSPNEITLKKGVPVILEITALDRDHGFKIPELDVRADLKSGEVTRVRIVPDRTGTFEFRCDVFCGSGHEDMSGEIVVVD